MTERPEGAETVREKVGPSPKEGATPPATFRAGPVRDPVVPVLYVILLLVVLLELPRIGIDLPALYVIAAVLALYLARELSIFYTIDEDHLNAWRLFGWRRVPLTSVRKIEEISLRDLSPTGLFGTWGWRSRLWSPVVGRFDAVYTYHKGLLVHADEVPLFVSPAHREEFEHELARRAEAVGSSVEVPDVEATG